MKLDVLAGEQHPSSKLSDQARDEIVQLISEGVSTTEVARRYKISRGYVSQVARSWPRMKAKHRK